MIGGVKVLCPENRHFDFKGSFSELTTKYMAVGIDRCTPDNSLSKDKKCAEPREIDKFINNLRVFTIIGYT